MKYLALVLIVLSSLPFLSAQSYDCPSDPPVNTWLADSPWPTYHRNSYRQSSTCLQGPLPTDSLVLKSKLNLRGGTSPWVYISEPYADGNKVLYYSNATFVYKLLDDGESIRTLDSFRIDFDLLDFGWNFLLTRDRIWFTYDPKSTLSSNGTTALFKLTDADTTDSASEIIAVDTFLFEGISDLDIQIFALNYDGQIVFNSKHEEDKGYATLGIIDQDFNLLDTIRYPCSPGEIVHHNAVAVDENNSVFVVTTERLIRFDWDGDELTLAWSALYDFVADGPTGSFAEGSGTTPTLIGHGEGNDKLVVVADGHAKNHLVAFWRELPAGWTGRPGMDIHFADSISIPYAQSFSNTFQSIENSPTAHQYDIAIAQFNGFLGYACDNLKGVQKFRWEQEQDELSLQWATDEINMNGVITYSETSNIVYGSGKEADCNYYYYGLDWDSGDVVMRHLLGPESGMITNDPYYDAGNNNIIDEDGNIYFAGGKSVIKLENLSRTVSTAETLSSSSTLLYPNPASDQLCILSKDARTIRRLQIYSASGVLHLSGDDVSLHGDCIDVSFLVAGMYYLILESDSAVEVMSFVKM